MFDCLRLRKEEIQKAQVHGRKNTSILARRGQNRPFARLTLRKWLQAFCVISGRQRHPWSVESLLFSEPAEVCERKRIDTKWRRKETHVIVVIMPQKELSSIFLLSKISKLSCLVAQRMPIMSAEFALSKYITNEGVALSQMPMVKSVSNFITEQCGRSFQNS